MIHLYNLRSKLRGRQRTINNLITMHKPDIDSGIAAYCKTAIAD